jgi:flagellar export protein FliJ
VEARHRSVQSAEAELAARVRASREASLAVDAARGQRQARLLLSRMGECSSEDLAVEHAYLGTLEKRLECLSEVAAKAKAEEERARRDLSGAKTEHKKVETWRDRLLEVARLEEARVERRQNDELAARIARRT